MSTATARKKARLLANAEVTSTGIKVRGDPIKGKQRVVTVKDTPVGKFKKNLLTACFMISAAGNAVGITLDWTPEMVHVAYPLAGVAVLYLVTSFLTKME